MSGSQWRRVGKVVRRSRGARGLLVLAIGAAGLLTPMAAFGGHGGGGGSTSTRTTTTTTTGTTTTTTTGTTTTTPSGSAASFQGLGQIPGGDVQSFGLGVSGDGKVAVGYSLDSLNVEHAWRWTQPTGMQTITNTLGDPSAEGHAASSDGSIVAGLAYDNSGAGHQAFRWTAAGGMQGLGIYDADDMSSDGSVVVGSAVWTQSGGIQPPPPPLGGCCASALGVSSDGSVVTGWSTTSSGLLHAFRWARTTGAGLQDLGVTSGTESVGEDASANGAVVVGQARDNNDFWRAFRWTAAGGMSDLGTLGGAMSSSDSVSDNGSVIVGTSLTTSSSASNRAFRWTASKGMQDIQKLLLNAGATSVQGWILTNANRVSADGTVIVGTGLDPNKQTRAFRATLPLP
jgi:probable HAF family extracellular repeat protein